MNANTIFLIFDIACAAVSLFCVGGAILTAIQDRADCLAREQGTRRLVTGAR